MGIGGATLNYTGGSITPGSDGCYTRIVPDGWNGTVTPSLTGYTFSPDHVDYSNITASQTQDYIATQVFSISGNAGIGNATLNYAGGSTTAGGNGSYTIIVPSGWNGTVTPSLTGYTFSPDHVDYSNITASQTQDYIATIDTYTVNASSSGNGTITPSGDQTANYGDTPSFTLAPDPDYHIDSVIGNCGGTLTTDTYTTNAITSSCTVIANFAIDTHTLTFAAGTGGWISAPVATSPATYNYGDVVTMTASPDRLSFH